MLPQLGPNPQNRWKTFLAVQTEIRQYDPGHKNRKITRQNVNVGWLPRIIKLSQFLASTFGQTERHEKYLPGCHNCRARPWPIPIWREDRSLGVDRCYAENERKCSKNWPLFLNLFRFYAPFLGHMTIWQYETLVINSYVQKLVEPWLKTLF